MRRKIKSMIGYTIQATDGKIGEVKEFYFDDRTWTIRYLIVETGSWLFGRKVLLSPQALLTPNWETHTLSVNLTMAQIKDSPNIDTDKPISRQHEMDLYGHYPWGSYYWGSTMGIGGMDMSHPISIKQGVQKETSKSIADKEKEDPNLRSTDILTGYIIRATDGKIGDVEDLLINDQTWAIDYMEVDTGNLFPGKKVLLAPKWIKEINWKTSSVVVDASEDQVKNSPIYTDNQVISDSYETDLQNYYEYITRK